MVKTSFAGAVAAPMAARQPINVGNKAELQASAVIAAMPAAVSQQLPH